MHAAVNLDLYPPSADLDLNADLDETDLPEMPGEAVDDAESAYEDAERSYLLALDDGTGRDELARRSRLVETAAGDWEKIAYATFFARRVQIGGTHRRVIELEIRAEKAELLRELWADVSAAHAGKYRAERPS